MPHDDTRDAPGRRQAEDRSALLAVLALLLVLAVAAEALVMRLVTG